MASEITVPRLGWNMEEGTFVGWLKREGEAVRAGEALFTLEGEKATEDVESLDGGILRFAPGGPRPGDKVAVGAVIGYLAGADEAAAAPQQPAGSRASPRARRAARETGVDWTTVRGSGRTGRVRERDVREAASRAAPDPGRGGPPPEGVRVSPIRRTIAERLTTGLRSTAPVTLTTTADATNLVNLRNQFKAVAPAAGEVVPGYTDFLVKLTAAALRRHAPLCSRWENGLIIAPKSIDIGVAVDAEAGLFVPVVRDVPRLSLRQVAARARDLAERARRGALTSADMEGGAFTITNLGAFGVDAFTPIINYPQCAVLGVGRIQRRPVADGDQVVIREQVTLSLTFDHRVVDGAPAARFLQTLVALVENPGPALMP
jgi:pyruvate dehydrogenase E2 component (dihydrolipoamide acetyltransferase)